MSHEDVSHDGDPCSEVGLAFLDVATHDAEFGQFVVLHRLVEFVEDVGDLLGSAISG
jgi:hypothetical protein